MPGASPSGVILLIRIKEVRFRSYQSLDYPSRVRFTIRKHLGRGGAKDVSFETTDNGRPEEHEARQQL